VTVTINEWRSFTLPDPISTNAHTRNVSAAERRRAMDRGRPLRGRAKTEAYKAWIDEAILAVRQQLRPLPHCPGPFFLDMVVGGNVDIDNTVKCVGDLLKRVGLIIDDKPKYMQKVTVSYAEGQQCQVAIRPIGEWA
jgi:hypothetical protein